MRDDLFHEIHQKSRLSIKEVNETLKAYELYSSQWTILFLLDRQGPMTQTEIWKYLNVEAPTVTRTVLRLEETGWVVRLEGRDKRERIVRLSEKAEEKIPNIEAQISKLEEKMTASLSKEEQTQLLTLLRKIQPVESKEKEGSNDE